MHDFYKLGNQKPRNAVSGRGRSFLRSERWNVLCQCQKVPKNVARPPTTSPMRPVLGAR